MCISIEGSLCGVVPPLWTDLIHQYLMRFDGGIHPRCTARRRHQRVTIIGLSVGHGRCIRPPATSTTTLLHRARRLFVLASLLRPAAPKFRAGSRYFGHLFPVALTGRGSRSTAASVHQRFSCSGGRGHFGRSGFDSLAFGDGHGAVMGNW